MRPLTVPLTVPPAVKICGVRSADHARVAADAGADMVGLIFASSRRQVTVADARAITSAVYARRPRFVGVFVNEDAATVGRIAVEAGLDLVQLSGVEAAEECRQLRVPYIKVVHMRSGAKAADLLHIATQHPTASLIGLDTADISMWGGTGMVADWSIAAEVVQGLEQPVVLAGGLRPDNVAMAIRTVRPYGVDVSSGVETNGAKDDEKIRAFVAAAAKALEGDR